MHQVSVYITFSKGIYLSTHINNLDIILSLLILLIDAILFVFNDLHTMGVTL